jgi:transposase-like protein
MTQLKMYGLRRRSENIQNAVRLYNRFKQSHRDFEDLLVDRGVTVSYEKIRDTSQYANNRFEL